MTPEHASLVRATWAALAPNASAVADDFYRRLFVLAPAAAPLFAHVDMRQQRGKFLGMLAGLVRVLDDPDALVRKAAPSGRRHVDYGAEAAHYPIVGAVLLQTLEHALGDAWTPAVCDAWRELYTLVADVMQRAA